MLDADDDVVMARWSSIVFPGADVRRVDGQRVGSAVDYMVGSTRIELKRDVASAETGNIFVEFEQTFDRWRTKKPSGLSLALSQADWYVVLAAGSRKNWFFYETPQNWLAFARSFWERDTATEKNGNKPKAFARGYVVPIRALMEPEPPLAEP